MEGGYEVERPSEREIIKPGEDTDLTELAFIQRVQTYQGKLLRLCHNILLDRQAAEDAAQEAFLKAWLKRGQFKGDSSYITWLYAIAVNTCLSMKKKMKPQVELSDSLPAPAPTVSDPGVETALSKLLPRDRVMLYMRAVEEYEFPEIAKMFGISIYAARKRYERARKKFKDNYANEGGVIYEPRPAADGHI